MDEKGLSLSVPGLCEQTGSDAAPLGGGRWMPHGRGQHPRFADLRQVQRPPAEFMRENSLITYSGLSSGFAKASPSRYAQWESRLTLSLGILPLLPADPTKEDN
jgi:hypothetical protein